MANEVFDTARTILAVREYSDRPIPHDVMRRVMDAGHLSASASNRQPWHFILVEKPDAIRELGGLVRTGPYIAGAKAAVIVAVDKATAKADVDAARAIQQMMLVAWADGVGSNWTGFGGLEGVREWAGLLAIPSGVAPKGRRVISSPRCLPSVQALSPSRTPALSPAGPRTRRACTPCRGMGNLPRRPSACRRRRRRSARPSSSARRSG